MQKLRVGFVGMAFLAACGLQAQAAITRTAAIRSDPRVTPVTGESWLLHLNRPFGDTSMGKTGRLAPPPSAGGDAPSQSTPAAIPASRNAVRLHGSDLYRLNCQGCHGESGLGTPPEINSIINPVRATSVPLILERMKKTGLDITYADATKLAQQSKTALLERLQQGGESMPAFPHLNDAETRPLLAYLKRLSDVPGAEREQTSIEESPERIGELIVKSTCHTCHSAAGADPGPQELSAGAIPPLSALTRRKSLPDFIGKVTQGSPVMMGAPPLLYRGRMPVFYYLSQEEVADVYRYLTLYPPAEHSGQSPLIAASLQKPPGSPNRSDPSTQLKEIISGAASDKESTRSADLQRAALPWTEALVALMLAGGLAFTAREFRRLSATSSGGKAHTRNIQSISVKPRPVSRTARVAQQVRYSAIKRSSR